MFYAKAIQRSLHTAATSYVRRKANPGIGIQTQVYQREGVAETDHEFDDFEEMESDFMQVHKSGKQHQREIESQREQMRLWVVKNKYFREKNPNFLTYSEKEQIKLLHSRDSEEWTLEKLAESFPASQETIQKVVRSKWRARSADRIKEHDEAVMKNWESLRKGELSVKPELKEHLTKFASRKLEDLQNVDQTWSPRAPLPRPKRTDFLSLITSCKGYADKEPTQKMLSDAQARAILPLADDEDSYLSEKVKNKRKMRLQELKASKLVEATEFYPVTLENPSGTGVIPTVDQYFVDKYSSGEVVISRDDIKKFEMTKVKDKIYIPKKLRKRGATYKVEDCYYDDDGEFLYRVPGMTS